MITKEIAQQLTSRNELFHVTKRRSDGFPVKCRVNGKCKTWVRQPNKFRLPVKHGLRDCFYITEANATEWETVQQLSQRTSIRYQDYSYYKV